MTPELELRIAKLELRVAKLELALNKVNKPSKKDLNNADRLQKIADFLNSGQQS